MLRAVSEDEITKAVEDLFEFTVSLLEALCGIVNSAPDDVSLGYILARLKAGNAPCGPEE